jgi:hypothetical protein
MARPAAGGDEREERSTPAVKAIFRIADDLTANERIRVVPLVVAVPPDRKTIRRLALPERPGAKAARIYAHPVGVELMSVMLARLGRE